MMEYGDIRAILSECGLKITPQRLIVFRAMKHLGHACAEDIVNLTLSRSRRISLGTVYNVLECFADRGIISRVNTVGNKMFFDINTYPHHHIYTASPHHIEDIYDEGLTAVVEEYVSRMNLPENFRLDTISVQLTGSFDTPDGEGVVEK